MRCDYATVTQNRAKDITAVRARLLISASPAATQANAPKRGFRVRRSAWEMLRAAARQPKRVLGHTARHLQYKSKRRIRRMRQALGRQASQLQARVIGDGQMPAFARNSLGLLALEPRVVFDAAAIAIAEQTVDQFAKQQAEAAADPAQADSSFMSTADPTADLHAIDYATISAPEFSRHEIAFVDGSVADVQDIIATIASSIEIVMLDPSRDGVEQIAATLAGRTGVDAIHIISHGSEGQLKLGSAVLNAASMQGQHLDELTTIGAALMVDADILIYGCDFTAGEMGLKPRRSSAA